MNNLLPILAMAPLAVVVVVIFIAAYKVDRVLFSGLLLLVISLVAVCLFIWGVSKL